MMLISIHSIWEQIGTSSEDWATYKRQWQSLMCSSPDLETYLSQPQYLGQLYLDGLLNVHQVALFI